MVLLAARAFAFPNLRELAPAYAGVFALLDRQTRTAEASPCHHSSERKSYRLDRQARTAEASPCHHSSERKSYRLDRQARTAEASPCHHSSERKSYRLDRQARTAEASPCHRSSRASARIGGTRGKGAMHSPLSAGRPILVCLARSA